MAKLYGAALKAHMKKIGRKAGKGGTKTVAKKGNHRKRAGLTIPVAAIGGFVPLAINAVEEIQTRGMKDGIRATVQDIVPYNVYTGKFDASRLHVGLYPILFGMAVHMIANKVGINRMLASARVPIFRL
jgi:hypothetical protein